MSHIKNSQSEGSDTASLMPIFATITKQKFMESIMLKTTTISALVLAVAIISAPAQASVKQITFDNNFAKVSSTFQTLDIGDALAKTAANSPEAIPLVVAWSIKGAIKKTVKVVKKAGSGVKKAGSGIKRFGSVSKKLVVGTGRQVGRGLKRANRVIVPSEIRNGASTVYRKTKKIVKHVIKHPYGKRCAPNKFLAPVCKVYPKRPRTNIRANIHDHRRANISVNRRANVSVNRR